MPHDMKGNELKVGSTVLIPCQVKAIHLTEEYCNVDLETNIVMHPTSNRTHLTLNSRQTIRSGSTNELELLRASRVIIDYVRKNGVSEGFGDTVMAMVYNLAPKLDKALESDDPEPQKACDVPLGRRGARDGC